jgi:hypothetical protein
MSFQTNANIHVGEGTTIETSKTSIDVIIDNTVSAEASASINTDYASAEIGVSVKTGTEAEVKAGLIDIDGKTAVVVEVSYSDTTEAHVTASSSIGAEGVGVAIGVDAYAKTGTEASANMSVGQNGVSAGAEASIGNCVGVDAEATVGLREASVTAGAGVSIGEHLECGGSAGATFDHGVATVSVSGDVAALIGVEADVSISIDTNQIVKDGKVIVKESEKVANTVAKETVDKSTKVVNTVTNTVNDTAHKAKKEVNKIGKSIKKGLHL